MGGDDRADRTAFAATSPPPQPSPIEGEGARTSNAIGRARSARTSGSEAGRRGDPADELLDPAEWTPRHALAPGLHVVATPIGNLGDITLRALWVLRRVDRILCEDTRVTQRLLARHGIDKPLDPYHDHNADRVRPGIIEALRYGATLALVSDAGTPLVADPGFKLVRDALAGGLPVTAAPGPSAAVTALVLSGLPPDPFLFAGFLPPRPAARRRALLGWRDLAVTLICYEGPSRLAATLADMAEIFGERDGAVARELTKRHEEIRRGRLAALAAHYRAGVTPRGEMVIVVGPPEATTPIEEADLDTRLRALLAAHSLRDAVALLARETGLPRRAVYERALATHDDKGSR